MAAIALAIALIFTGQFRNSEMFWRIQYEAIPIGMERSSVLRILGEPGDYSTTFAFYFLRLGGVYSEADYWFGNNAMIIIGYDARGKVGFKEFQRPR